MQKGHQWTRGTRGLRELPRWHSSTQHDRTRRGTMWSSEERCNRHFSLAARLGTVTTALTRTSNLFEGEWIQIL